MFGSSLKYLNFLKIKWRSGKFQRNETHTGQFLPHEYAISNGIDTKHARPRHVFHILAKEKKLYRVAIYDSLWGEWVSYCSKYDIKEFDLSHRRASSHEILGIRSIDCKSPGNVS